MVGQGQSRSGWLRPNIRSRLLRVYALPYRHGLLAHWAVRYNGMKAQKGVYVL